MAARLDFGLRSNFNPFLPANGLVLNGTNVSGNLFDLQVNGASRFKVENTSDIRFFGSNTTSGISPISDSSYGMTFNRGSPGIFFGVTNSLLGTFIIRAGFVVVGATSAYTWSVTANRADAASDLYLYRDAAGTLAQRNGVNAQAFNIYNTYTDASNYERGIFDWQSNTNVLTIGTQNAGTGSARDLRIIANNNTVAYFSSNGLVTVNNSILIGNSTISTTITPTTASLINLSPLLLMGS